MEIGTLPPPVFPSGDWELGEIVLAPQYIQACCGTKCQPSARALTLLVHSFCHLLGYTHDNAHALVSMEQRERVLLRTITATSARCPDDFSVDQLLHARFEAV